MIIYSVSPSYLNYMFKESSDYSFHIQGYGSLRQAISRLGTTNSTDIFGFLVVLDKLPDNTTLLREFIEACDDVSVNSPIRKRLVLGVHSSEGVNSMVSKLKLKNIDIYMSKFDIMTDLFIRRDLFGPILTSHFSAYEGQRYEDVRYKSTPMVGSLKYSPLFSSYDMMCIADVFLRNTLRETEIEDTILEELKSSEFHYKLRRYFIALQFKNEVFDDHEVEGLIRAVANPRTQLHYEMMYEYVREVIEK